MVENHSKQPVVSYGRDLPSTPSPASASSPAASSVLEKPIDLATGIKLIARVFLNKAVHMFNFKCKHWYNFLNIKGYFHRIEIVTHGCRNYMHSLQEFFKLLLYMTQCWWVFNQLVFHVLCEMVFSRDWFCQDLLKYNTFFCHTLICPTTFVEIANNWSFMCF